MKKHYFLLFFALLLGMAVNAQSSSGALQSVQKFKMELSSPDHSLISREVQPLTTKNPLIDFDSLNVTYQGSWGFGQSFSIGSNSAGTIDFIGSGAGVIILDVSNPAIPVKLSEISTRGLVDAIYFDETTNRLYVAAYFAGFEIWDLSNLSAPVKIGGGPITGLPRGGIYASGNYVYVVSVADGVQVFDITTPSSPVNVGNCIVNPDYLAWSSAKSGNLIFVALSEGGMSVVDVTDPANPFVAGTYADIVYGISIANDYAYAVSYNFGLNILNISDLSNITVVGNCVVPGFPYRVQLQGNYAYVGNADSGLGGINVVDVSNPASPSLITTFAGYAEHLAAAGNTLAYTGGSYPCNILDITNPAAPALANTYSLPIFTSDVYVDGNYAYTGNNGFRVFDITDKKHPVQVGYNSTDGSIVRTVGDKAVYIRESMTSNNPVMVMDIADPTNPAFMGQYNSPVMTNDLEVRDNYAFVSCWWDGIRIINIADPANPVLVKHAMGWTSGGTPGVTYCYAQAIDVEGNFLYIIDYGPFEGEDTRGLYILDISDINNPVLVKHFTDFTSYGYDLDVVGDFVYIADNYGGMEVIDVTDKNNPVTCGYVNLPDGANSVKVTENNAFVADYINGGVQVIDVSNPYDPFLAGYYLRSGCFALGVDVKGQYIYLADGAGGFQIYFTPLITGTKNNQATESKYTSWPNPFIDQMTIKVDNPGITDKSLRIYDASGNWVATLYPSDYSSTVAIYRWNGKTTSGKSVSPGLYFYSSGSTTGKLIKIL
ncbi:MAG TPA: T9SS type A sorting domain-containing protein [Lentimicrobium sp.]|nr:T9SS type A sorting domain-containing protein [Lentimicrobium sp.]